MRYTALTLLFVLGATACEREAATVEPTPDPAVEPAPRVPTAKAVMAAKKAGVAPMNRMNVAGPFLDGVGAFVFVHGGGAISRLDVKTPSIQYGDLESGKLELVMTISGLYAVNEAGKGVLVTEPFAHGDRLTKGPHYGSTLGVFHELAEPLRASKPEGFEVPETIDTDASWMKEFSDVPGRMKDMGCERREVDGFFVGCF